MQWNWNNGMILREPYVVGKAGQKELSQRPSQGRFVVEFEVMKGCSGYIVIIDCCDSAVHRGCTRCTMLTKLVVGRINLEVYIPAYGASRFSDWGNAVPTCTAKHNNPLITQKSPAMLAFCREHKIKRHMHPFGK
jgi:hypothetical protein